MAARGHKTSIRLGGATVEVALLKTTSQPREARYETWREDEGGDQPEQPQPPELPSEAFKPLDVRAPTPLEDAPRPTPAAEGATAALAAEVRREVRQGVTLNGERVDLTEQLARIDEATRLEAMEPAAAVPLNSLPRERIVGSHWLAPSGPGSGKAIKLLATQLRAAGRGLAVTWTKKSNQALGVLVPHRRGRATVLLLLELAWADHWREPEDRVLAVQHAETTPGEHAAAERFVEAYAAPASALDGLVDTRLRARGALLEAARAGDADTYEPPELERPPEAAELGEVVDERAVA